MGKCPNCGHKAFFKKKLNCKICGKEICEKCRTYLFKIWSPHSIILDEWYACSNDCQWTLVKQVENQISLDNINFEDATPSIPQLVKGAILSEKYRKKLSHQVRKHGTNFSVNFAPLSELDFNPRDNVFWKKLNARDAIFKKRFEAIQMEKEAIQMENWMNAGRFEDAAKFLEKQGKFKEAGEMRSKGRGIIIKQT